MWNMFICCSGLSSILKSQGCQSFTTSDISEHAASESVYVGVCACRLFYCKCCVPEILFFTLVFCVRNCVWTCMWGFDVVKITVSLSAHTWQLTCCGWHDIPLTPGCCGRLPWFWDFREFLRVPRRPEGFLLVSVCAWGPETLSQTTLAQAVILAIEYVKEPRGPVASLSPWGREDLKTKWEGPVRNNS